MTDITTFLHFYGSVFLQKNRWGAEEKGEALSACGLPGKQRPDCLNCTSENRK